MGKIGRTLRRSLKLVLWTQLLDPPYLGFLLRFYGALWALTATILALSCLVLLNQPGGGLFGYPPIAIPLALVTVLASYLLTRLISPLLILLLCVVVPGTMVITPSIATHQEVKFEVSEAGSNVATGDSQLFGKGAGVAAALTGVTVALYLALRLPANNPERKRWPPRRATLPAMAVAGLAGLELLRIAAGVLPQFQPPWYGSMVQLMVEPGWAYAIAIWLWLIVGYLLAEYDVRLIPYLLQRIGHPWVPKTLSIQEVYLVDVVMTYLTARTHRPAAARRHR